MGIKYIEDVNDEVMDGWIKALRSGNYTQTEGRLYDPESKGMCCLGVYAAENGCTLDVDIFTFEGEGYYYLPPTKVLELLNLPSRNIDKGGMGDSVLVQARDEESNYVNANGLVGVATLNDHFQKTFNEIADRLEETFLRDEFKG